MAQSSLDAGAFGQLNHEQKALLDTVDNLRSQGVGEIVHLPQIIVVGDQSSGKSSVLEAISRVRFPVKGGICTRFATELVVRTCPQEEVAVTIRKANATSSGSNVGFSERGFSSSALPDLIERAKVSMGVRDDASGFSEDTLRIEVSGPDLPSLTLVDLPGIYRNETADQSREGMQIVWRLVEKYMKQENSIILAVVNASYDFSNQGILTEVKRYDPSRERTMGIVTNPDRLAQKSIDESKYVRLVRNQEPLHALKHGWHVLRNRGPEANDEQGQGSSRTSDEERDKAEKDFLSSGIWASLPDSVKGVDTLRRKLSKVLTKHIQLSLPGVIQDIEEKLETSRDTLARLGRPRTASAELRRYLHDVAENFRDLTRLAARGSYDDLKFFGDAYSTDYPCGPHHQSDARRLRAIIRNLNHAFDTVISAKGERRKIIRESDDADSDEESVSSDNGESDDEDEVPQSLSLYTELYDVDEPEEVTWEDLEEELETQASINQNTNFPGSPNDRLALNHFRDQSRRWRSIASMHLGLVIDSAKAFVELALAHVTAGDYGTRDALLREYIDPFFELRALRLEEKLDELLKHYKDGEALTLEKEFMRTLAAREERRVARQVKGMLDAEQSAGSAAKGQGKLSRSEVEQLLRSALETRVSRFGLEKVVDMATVYYEMSLRTFKENVIILAVENCLISELPSILTSSMVHEMDEEKLSALAAESPDLRQERIDLERDIRVLTEGLRICKMNRPRQSAAHTSNLSARAASSTQTNGTSVLPSSSVPGASPAPTSAAAHSSTGASAVATPSRDSRSPTPANGTTSLFNKPAVLPVNSASGQSIFAVGPQAAQKPLFGSATTLSKVPINFNLIPETKAGTTTGDGLPKTETAKANPFGGPGLFSQSSSVTPKLEKTSAAAATPPSAGLFSKPTSGTTSLFANSGGTGSTSAFGTSLFGSPVTSAAPNNSASGTGRTSGGFFGSGSGKGDGARWPPVGQPKVGGVPASTLTVTPPAPSTKGELPSR